MCCTLRLPWRIRRKLGIHSEQLQISVKYFVVHKFGELRLYLDGIGLVLWFFFCLTEYPVADSRSICFTLSFFLNVVLNLYSKIWPVQDYQQQYNRKLHLKLLDQEVKTKPSRLNKNVDLMFRTTLSLTLFSLFLMVQFKSMLW